MLRLTPLQDSIAKGLPVEPNFELVRPRPVRLPYGVHGLHRELDNDYNMKYRAQIKYDGVRMATHLDIRGDKCEIIRCFSKHMNEYEIPLVLKEWVAKQNWANFPVGALFLDGEFVGDGLYVLFDILSFYGNDCRLFSEASRTSFLNLFSYHFDIQELEVIDRRKEGVCLARSFHIQSEVFDLIKSAMVMNEIEGIILRDHSLSYDFSPIKYKPVMSIPMRFTELHQGKLYATLDQSGTTFYGDRIDPHEILGFSSEAKQMKPNEFFLAMRQEPNPGGKAVTPLTRDDKLYFYTTQVSQNGHWALLDSLVI